MPLSDTHLVLLSAASQHDHGLLPRPAKLAGSALHRVAAFLVKAAVAEVVPVRADQLSWRGDEAGTPLGLRITPAGLAAIGLEQPASGQESSATEPAADRSALNKPEGPAAGSEHLSPTPANKQPRAGTKLAQLTSMLARPGGTTVDALVTALHWQPHTVRAALTRLRQSGVMIVKTRTEQNTTAYRSAADSAAIAAAAGANSSEAA